MVWGTHMSAYMVAARNKTIDGIARIILADIPLTLCFGGPRLNSCNTRMGLTLQVSPWMLA